MLEEEEEIELGVGIILISLSDGPNRRERVCEMINQCVARVGDYESQKRHSRFFSFFF